MFISNLKLKFETFRNVFRALQFLFTQVTMATALTTNNIQDTLPSEYRHELKPADAVDALRTILTSLAEIESIDDAQVFIISNYQLSYFSSWVS